MVGSSTPWQGSGKGGTLLVSTKEDTKEKYLVKQRIVPVNAIMRTLVTIKIRVLEQFLPVINTY
ncbi:hypothetical protein OUZ56_005739 [Daphnia magna]|uniref:Uncharacterized protein n=1 Tax=Daphnia magna TaxID=35525 RepID=A0ABQ9YTM9_9CRUS|nr:hypothetical protein OUZ56_005739 [Daphnia magna]